MTDVLDFPSHKVTIFNIRGRTSICLVKQQWYNTPKYGEVFLLQAQVVKSLSPQFAVHRFS
jgi:hypothetical protein